MKKLVSLALALCLAIACIGTACADGIMTLGTGSTGGTDNVVIEALSSVVNSNSSMKTSTSTTSGGAEIIYLIQSGDLQGGYTGTIDLVNALNGAAPFAEAIPEEYMLQGFGFVTWALPVVVLDSSDIKTYEDLEGRHLGLPPAASSTTAVLNLVLDAYGLTGKVTIDYFTWSEGYTALKDGRIDAFVGSYANGAPISGIIEIEATNPIRCLNMSEEVAEAVKAKNPGVGARTLTNAECATIAEGETVLAPANSVEAVAVGVSHLEHVEALQNISTYFDAFLEVAAGVCVETVPFHPGAAKALKEAGLWQDSFIVYGE